MKEIIVKILKKVLKEKDIKMEDEKILSLIEIPKDYSKGDYAFPCFLFVKNLKMPPHQIALEIHSAIGDAPKEFKSIETDGPYINFYVDRRKMIFNLIKKIRKEKEDFGKSNLGKGEKTMIEFSQPNTHKAFHVGHIRGTSIGESLARIFEFEGSEVIRANYSGDTGMHIAKWIWCYKKFHAKEKLRDDESWIASIYVDAIGKLEKKKEYQEEVNEINRKLESKENSGLNKLWKKTRELSINSWKKIYDELNTHFDFHFFESKVEKKGKEISQELVKKKIAIVDDGATIVKFKDKKLGVCVLLRKDGTVLYSAKDLALAEAKFSKYKMDKSIHVVGAAQAHYFKQLFRILELMKFKQAKKCKHVAFAEVRLPTGKMSSRTGDNILYSDFMKEILDYTKKRIKEKDSKISSKELKKRALIVSIAAIKYSMLKQNSNRGIVFDKKEALNFEGNTGPYIQYAYARASSIFKKVNKIPTFKMSKELEEKELELSLALNEFGDICMEAYKNMNPALIANYSYKLAQKFNEFYHSCPVIGNKEENFRLYLIDSFRQVLKNSLYLLGIEVLEEM